jgi:hypothetical protein
MGVARLQLAVVCEHGSDLIALLQRDGGLQINRVEGANTDRPDPGRTI